MWLNGENVSVIVTCERCETKFQLDEARVPESGARVRCSRCKHAFVVHRPAASSEDEIDRAVSEGVLAGETPGVTDDLPDPAAEGTTEAGAESDWEFNDDGNSPFGDPDDSDPTPEPALAAESEEESGAAFDADSGFDTDSGFDADSGFDTDAGLEADSGFDTDAGLDAGPGSDTDAGFDADSGVDTDAGFDVSGFDAESDFGSVSDDEPLSLASEDDGSDSADDAPLSSSEAEESPFGQPVDATEQPEAATAAEAAVSPEGAAFEIASDAAETLGTPDEWDLFDDAADPTSSATTPATTPTAAAPAAGAVERRRVVAASVSRGSTTWLGRAGAAAGWAVVASLCLFGLVNGLVPQPVADPVVFVAPGIRAVEATGRWVDNARLGKLYVVSGQLQHENAGSTPIPALELVVIDAEGQVLEPTWRLASPRPVASLREGRANALSAVRAGFRRPLAAGESRAFEAVAWPLPREADRFEIRVAKSGG